MVAKGQDEAGNKQQPNTKQTSIVGRAKECSTISILGKRKYTEADQM